MCLSGYIRFRVTLGRIDQHPSNPNERLGPHTVGRGVHVSGIVFGLLVILVILVLIALLSVVRVVQEYERGIVVRLDLDALLSERDRINDELARVIDDLTEPWGVKVTLVEIKDVDLPDTMQRAMARQAEAERDRRARIISAEGEFQASQKLSEAAEVMARNPQALQLRFLQTVAEVAAERNSTLVMPIPVELLSARTLPMPLERPGPDRPDAGRGPERPV